MRLTLICAIMALALAEDYTKTLRYYSKCMISDSRAKPEIVKPPSTTLSEPSRTPLSYVGTGTMSCVKRQPVYYSGINLPFILLRDDIKKLDFRITSLPRNQVTVSEDGLKLHYRTFWPLHRGHNTITKKQTVISKPFGHFRNATMDCPGLGYYFTLVRPFDTCFHTSTWSKCYDIESGWQFAAFKFTGRAVLTSSQMTRLYYCFENARNDLPEYVVVRSDISYDERRKAIKFTEGFNIAGWQRFAVENLVAGKATDPQMTFDALELVERVGEIQKSVCNEFSWCNFITLEEGRYYGIAGNHNSPNELAILDVAGKHTCGSSPLVSGLYCSKRTELIVTIPPTTTKEKDEFSAVERTLRELQASVSTLMQVDNSESLRLLLAVSETVKILDTINNHMEVIWGVFAVFCIPSLLSSIIIITALYRTCRPKKKHLILYSLDNGNYYSLKFQTRRTITAENIRVWVQHGKTSVYISNGAPRKWFKRTTKVAMFENPGEYNCVMAENGTILHEEPRTITAETLDGVNLEETLHDVRLD